ncbi:glucosaminidase domain-containing protein [Variovorax sp. J22G21]|uniref:glucosaminidase domain-containing protein n=1 Tax=Variovorax fucosicus TaxID=3053517 RepID=UPI002579125B|nr:MULTISPECIES: glucosaminidase domain-containing protein [unclassified Variovorax]MDM0040270.1 glucosaminidase domain-containing protein [Variovorax sp. J22R193]MDM0058388.1 glucosaminidase domain-containing protein [Variovorax sp. J22G47]MDM0061643.1 glucosaminidase domain-containing protein [Variovorax sp. J22G21]
MNNKNRPAATTPARPNGKEQFIANLYPAAVTVSQQTGMSKELILAQAALETGWGEKVLPGTNNLFNIKASPDWRGPTKTFSVPEFVGGKKVMVDAEFRVYGSNEKALNDRVKFLQENPRYAESGLFDLGTKGNLEKEATALQKAGYATDPEYAKQLAAVYHSPTMQRAVKAATLGSLAEEGHPGHPLYKQAKSALQEIDAQFGRKPDQLTDNAAAAITVAALRGGLTRIDRITLGGNDNSTIFAIQGNPGTALSKVVDVPTVESMNTPVAQSSQAFTVVQQAQQQATQQNSQHAAHPTAPSMSR